MKKLPQSKINNIYDVLIEGIPCHEIDPELYDEMSDDLDIISPDYINRTGVEYGERVIYWEANYNPSYERMGENDGDKEKAIIDTLEEYGLDFDTDLVAKYPADYED